MQCSIDFGGTAAGSLDWRECLFVTAERLRCLGSVLLEVQQGSGSAIFRPCLPPFTPEADQAIPADSKICFKSSACQT